MNAEDFKAPGELTEHWVQEYEPENPDDSVPDVFTLKKVDARLDAMQKQLDALNTGVNTIGEMMNYVVQGFNEAVAKLNAPGGIAGMLGGLMGKNNG